MHWTGCPSGQGEEVGRKSTEGVYQTAWKFRDFKAKAAPQQKSCYSPWVNPAISTHGQTESLLKQLSLKSMAMFSVGPLSDRAQQCSLASSHPSASVLSFRRLADPFLQQIVIVLYSLAQSWVKPHFD